MFTVLAWINVVGDVVFVFEAVSVFPVLILRL